MSQAVQYAQGFFLQLDTHRSGELLNAMPVPTMITLLKFGKRMSQEAQEEAIECKLLGRELEANATAKDVGTIQKNLNSLQKAYDYAMN